MIQEFKMDEKDMMPGASQENDTVQPSAEGVSPAADASATPASAQPATGETPTTQPVATPEATQAQPAQPVQPVQPVQPQGAPASTPASAPVAPVATTPMTAISPTPALILGILAIVFCWIPIIGIILGIVAIVQAGKYFRAGGTEGTAKGGKICGIIGIVLSGLMIIFSLISVALGLAILENYGTTSTTTTTPQSEVSSKFSAIDADEQEVFDAVDPYMEKIKNQDPEMVARIANIMETSFNEVMADSDLDATLQTCGVDPTQLAIAMMTGFDYTYDYVYGDDTESEANYEVTVRSASEVGNEFYDQIVDMLDSLDLTTTSESDIYRMMGETLMNAVQTTQPSESPYFDIVVKKVDGKWVVDEESFDEDLDYLFALA